MALLDAAEGVEYEGEDQPQATEHDQTAFLLYRLMANGMGGVDWSGLPFLCGWLGLQDVEAVMQRLVMIRMYRKPSERGD